MARPVGSTSADTRRFKIALNNLLELVADDMADWLRQVADESPEKAFDLVLKAAKFVYPNAEISTGGGPLSISINNFVVEHDQNNTAKQLDAPAISVEVVDISPERG